MTFTPSCPPSSPLPARDVYSVEELRVRVARMDNAQCACVVEFLVGELQSADDPGLRAALSRAYRALYVAPPKEVT